MAGFVLNFLAGHQEHLARSFAKHDRPDGVQSGGSPAEAQIAHRAAHEVPIAGAELGEVQRRPRSADMIDVVGDVVAGQNDAGARQHGNAEPAVGHDADTALGRICGEGRSSNLEGAAGGIDSSAISVSTAGTRN